jgi:hypothetical protein
VSARSFDDIPARAISSTPGCEDISRGAIRCALGRRHISPRVERITASEIGITRRPITITPRPGRSTRGASSRGPRARSIRQPEIHLALVPRCSEPPEIHSALSLAPPPRLLETRERRDARQLLRSFAMRLIMRPRTGATKV